MATEMLACYYSKIDHTTPLMRLHGPRTHRSRNLHPTSPSTTLLPLPRPQTLQNIRIPPLPNIRVTLDPIPQRRLPQRPRNTPFPERKLHIVQPPPTIPLNHRLPLRPHVRRNLAHPNILEVVKVRIAANALEEGDREARAGARGGGEHAVRGAGAHALRQRLESLADGHDERAVDGGAVDPVPPRVLNLKSCVGGGLEEV